MATLEEFKESKEKYLNPPDEENEQSDFSPIQLDADLKEYLGVFLKLRFIFKNGKWKSLLLIDGKLGPGPRDWKHVEFSHLYIRDPESLLRLAKWCLLAGFTLKGAQHAEEIAKVFKTLFEDILKLSKRFWHLLKTYEDKLNEKGEKEQKSLEDL